MRRKMPGGAQLAQGADASHARGALRRLLCALLAVFPFVGCTDPPPSLGGREGPHRIKVRRNVSVEAPDRIRLRGDLYLPAGLSGPLPSILIRLPYNREWYEPATLPARFFASWGYAVLVQDVRGRWGSEGRYRVLADDRSDGVATLAWMASQPWSILSLGTY
jgi:predicted acyl esterase